jgi:hypothetical protein
MGSPVSTLPGNVIRAFNYAQTFYLDADVVQGAEEICLTAVDLYFRAKPKDQNNSSGILEPGVTVFLTETAKDGIPIPYYISGGISRREFSEIQPTNDASSFTNFQFEYPVRVKTGKKYAIIIKFDGNESFDLWRSVEGNPLVEDGTKNAGPAGQYIGDFFERNAELNFILTNSAQGAGTGNGDTNQTKKNETNISSLDTLFKPIKDTDLKFSVYAAKFNFDTYSNTSFTSPSGLVITNIFGKRSFILPKQDYEFVSFDAINSTNYLELRGGELIYQNNVIQPTTLVVSNGSTLVTGSNVNFSTLYDPDSLEEQYIVIFSGSSKNIRRVIDIQSNTSIDVDRPVTFSNAQAQFSKVVAAEVDIANETKVFRKKEDLLLLNNSNANSSLRFTNNVIEAITINNGGSGYSNSDYIVVNGGGASSTAPEVNAISNVITDATGNIISYSLSNMGIGFVETPSFVILNSVGDPSSGSGADLSFSVGCTLKTELSNASITNCQIINMPLNTIRVGGFDLENPVGSSFVMKHHYLYYSAGDGIVDIAIYEEGSGYSNNAKVTITGGGGTGAEAYILTDSSGRIKDVVMSAQGSGYTTVPTLSVSGGSGANLVAVIGVSRYTSNQHSSAQTKNEQLLERYPFEGANTPLILSRSYEVTQPEVQITLDTGLTVNTNISSVVELVITSNNEFSTVDLESGKLDVLYSKYAINNDYRNEHLGNGNAIAKHISKKINFAEDRFAEDIRVFFDAYRPSGTDIKVYAKIHNNNDPEPFDDKNWTLLEYKNDTQFTYSTLGNYIDEAEYECGFSSYPNSQYTTNGTVTTSLSNTTVIGSGTFFDNELAADDLVKVYSPLFPNNYFISVVDSVTSNTEIELKDAISNNNVVGDGLLIDKLEFKNQAFNNYLNDNVVRYYDGSMRQYDTYNTVAVKLVLLSESENIIPRVNNIRVIGVSA